MNNRVNYTFVGILVLVGIALLILFAYWMLSPSKESETKMYAINFDESVLGLNLDAPVKYRGISVGKVEHIGINEKNLEQVEVIVSIKKATPIKEDTVAQLTAQGITGLSYINLNLGSNSAQMLLAREGERYPTIKSIPSFLSNFEESIGSVSSRLTATLGKTEKLLGDKNQEEVSRLLQKSASIMEKMDRLLDDKTIAHIQNSVKNIDSFSQKMDALVPQVEGFIQKSEAWEDKITHSFASIMQSYLGIKGSMEEIKRAVSSGEFNLKEITADVVPTMNNTLLEMQNFLIHFDSLLHEYKKSPSDVIFKSVEEKKAPGER